MCKASNLCVLNISINDNNTFIFHVWYLHSYLHILFYELPLLISYFMRCINEMNIN